MIRYFFVLLLFILVTIATEGQHSPDSTRSMYIQKFPDQFFIWPLFKKRSLSFDIRNGDNEKIKYKPNNSFSLGLGVYLFEISAEISFEVPINEKSQSTFGSTDAREFHINFLGNNWGVDVFRQKYNGFYFTDPAGSSPDVIIKRPDIELTNTGINAIYAFNKKKFSLKAAYNYSERQLISGGSFIATGNLNTFRLFADSVILTKQSAPQSTNSDLLLMRYTTISVAGGYTYTLVYRSFFLNGALSVGPAHNWILYSRPGGEDKYDMAVNTFSDIRFSLGYNSDRFFGGMSLVSQSRNIRFDDIQFANTNTFAKLLIGYRFNEVGILKKRAKDYIPRNLP
jgi:Domain of unknown function (DUF4421)